MESESGKQRVVEHTALLMLQNGAMKHSKGFGLECLKSCPKDFPRDYEYMNYLRMKDYCAWVRLPDDFFEGDKWIEEVVRIFKIGKPMMDFMNDVIADYEP